MRFIPCQQGTIEWFNARAGVITASMFSTAVAKLQRDSGERKKGDFTATSDKYAADTAIEIISGKPYGEPPKAWTLQRGHDLEPLARAAYEALTGEIAEEAGFTVTDDGAYGYSTDGMVEPRFFQDRILSATGIIEIKCPVDSQKILEIWAKGDLSEYEHQMQGGMWITGAQWCDFIMYVPDLASVGKDVYVKRVPRNEKFIAQLETDLLAFHRRVKVIEATLRAPAANLDQMARAA